MSKLSQVVCTVRRRRQVPLSTKLMSKGQMSRETKREVQFWQEFMYSKLFQDKRGREQGRYLFEEYFQNQCPCVGRGLQEKNKEACSTQWFPTLSSGYYSSILRWAEGQILCSNEVSIIWVPYTQCICFPTKASVNSQQDNWIQGNSKGNPRNGSQLCWQQTQQYWDMQGKTSQYFTLNNIICPTVYRSNITQPVPQRV